MSFIFPLLLLVLIPSIDSHQPTLKLTFTPDEKFFTHDHQVEIYCEILNPTDRTESPQLWHIDSKTGKHTAISRLLINSPADDAPEIFKQNKQKRIEYIRKNHIRIRRLQVEDSSKFECNCPDCEEQLGKKTADLQVMKLSEPKWHIEPALPLQENAKATFRCSIDNFYPYVSHKILRNHHDITNEGKSNLPTSNVYPQQFSWESTASPAADWHNVSLRCTVTQGNSERSVSQHLEILFIPRFRVCHETQFVNASSEKAIIECSFAGNPAPKLLWFRQSDGKQIHTDVGITIDTKDEHHGKYKSIITFERDKLVAVPLTTTTKAPNAAPETSTPAKITGDNYYEQLLNGGFTVKLISSQNEEKATKSIRIVNNEQQARVKTLDSPSSCSRSTSLTSILLGFLSMLFFLIVYP